MITKTVATGLIENEEGKILISLRNDPTVPAAHLKWDFPGGVIDFGETARETVKREVLEETNLDISVCEMIPVCYCKVWKSKKYGKIHAIVLCYHCELESGEAFSDDPKIKELRWVKKEELEQYECLPSIKEFILASKL